MENGWALGFLRDFLGVFIGWYIRRLEAEIENIIILALPDTECIV